MIEDNKCSHRKLREESTNVATFRHEDSIPSPRENFINMKQYKRTK